MFAAVTAASTAPRWSAKGSDREATIAKLGVTHITTWSKGTEKAVSPSSKSSKALAAGTSPSARAPKAAHHSSQTLRSLRDRSRRSPERPTLQSSSSSSSQPPPPPPPPFEPSSSSSS